MCVMPALACYHAHCTSMRRSCCCTWVQVLQHPSSFYSQEEHPEQFGKSGVCRVGWGFLRPAGPRLRQQQVRLLSALRGSGAEMSASGRVAAVDWPGRQAGHSPAGTAFFKTGLGGPACCHTRTHTHGCTCRHTHTYNTHAHIHIHTYKNMRACAHARACTVLAARPGRRIWAGACGRPRRPVH